MMILRTQEYCILRFFTWDSSAYIGMSWNGEMYFPSELSVEKGKFKLYIYFYVQLQLYDSGNGTVAHL